MPKQPVPVYSLANASRRLKVPRYSVSLLVRIYRIPTYPMALNGKAKGLTESGFRKLERVARQLAIAG